MQDMSDKIKVKGIQVCRICTKPIKATEPHTVVTAHEHLALVHSTCAAGLKADSPPEVAESRGRAKLGGRS